MQHIARGAHSRAYIYSANMCLIKEAAAAHGCFLFRPWVLFIVRFEGTDVSLKQYKKGRSGSFLADPCVIKHRRRRAARCGLFV